jgi:alcohol dehydrogenase class IV
LIAINTTAGTASEMTRFCIITDESRHIKMAIVDRNVTPILSVNDPELMLAKPKGLTAATGMDALTRAVEAYVSIAATPITDACALKAVELIALHLRSAVAHGDNLQAREQMAYAQFLAGMAFNNASLGYVHAMAHQLGGFTTCRTACATRCCCRMWRRSTCKPRLHAWPMWPPPWAWWSTRPSQKPVHKPAWRRFASWRWTLASRPA